MQRTIFDADHDSFRDTVRTFCDKEIAPHHKEWEAAGIVSRELWLKAGALGLLGFMRSSAVAGSTTTVTTSSCRRRSLESARVASAL